ncbi:MAG: glycoside hydrolase family 88 protein [Prevotella sp.]|nr:glycoside hydrolase family 88 protein [Prevotella sp.]
MAKAQTDVNFNDGVRYSQWVIDSRMNEFYANTTKCGFAVYDQSGKQTADRVDGKTSLDYVVGLVAKSIIEASQYYSQFTWAQSFAKPWFLSIQNYGNKFYSGVATSGGSLDDLNAVKLYLPLRELTKPGGTFEDNTTYSNTATALNKAITGLKAHNSSYRIKDENILAKKAGHDVLGGWWHKKAYENQMWLDGAYMGSALFAELVNYSGKTTNIDSSNDWALIVKQFTILHEMCWNETDKLPYHAFAADGGTNSTSHSDTWYELSSKSPYCFHSYSYWGRAVGWYFLALVDILEQMDKANLSSSAGYTTLKGYLEEIAGGLKARQDQATGGWYQILDETDGYSASSYNGKSYTQTKNYIESSATALFTAAYLKAIRKGYLDEKIYKTVAVNGYKCLVNQFFSVDDNGNVNIFGSCRSAGLGGSGDNYKAGKERFRDGSKPYYLLGYDVARVDKSEKITEGKVLGAFILAATEYERQYQSPMLLSKDLNKSYTLGPNESLSAEVLGEGTATYQWYNANTSTAIDGATNASYIPTESGKYYCKITVNPTTAAKTRAASTSGSYTITTSTADVTVSENVVSTDVLQVTTNGQTFDLTQTNIEQYDYASVSKTDKWVSKKIDNTSYTLFNMSSTDRTITLKVSGASSFEVKVQNRTKGRTYSISVTDANGTKSQSTITHTGTGVESSGIINTNSTGEITIELTGGGESVYPYQIIFYTGSTETSGYTISYSTSVGTAPASKSNITTLTAAELPTLTATGYTFDGWYFDKTFSKQATAGATISANTTLYAKWTVTVTANAANAANGTVTITDGSGNTIESGSQVNYGTKLVFTATANSGYKFSSWTVNGTTVAANGATYTISSLTEATSVTANFTETSSGGGGTATYSYKVEKASIAGPKINTSLYITDNSNKKLVKMTFGGWKWEGYANKDATEKTLGSYKVVRGDKTTYYTDKWNDSGTKASDIASIDGHYYWWNGQNDAVDESKALTGTIYGTPRYGWFVSPTRDASGKTTESHPFTLPVRGSFMTFEPTMNGTLSIYILQNGAWNTDKSGTYTDTDGEGTINYSKGQIAAGEFRPHAFHVVNQRGLTVQEFSPKYSVETRQTVNSQYYCMFEGDKGFNQTDYDSPYNVARWTEFKDYMSATEKQRCHDNWNNGEGGAQTITELDNGSFLAIEKGIVKYTFHVTGNETYYFFSNFSKMGFSGARFTPDEAQPEETVTGKISTLDLSDVTAYNEITYTEKGTIAGTNLKNYTYKIGDKEIAPVDGVTIPQFYSIKLDRTFKAGQWTTLTLPFNLTEEEVQKIFGDGTQIIMLDKATLSSEGGARLHFIYHEIQNVLPGYPYLIKPTLTDITNDANVSVTKADNNTALTSFTVFGKCINPFIDQFEVDTDPYTFKGTPDYCTANVSSSSTQGYSVNYAKNDIFVSDSDGKLYVSGGASYGKGYRAWLKKNPGTNAVKSISVVMSSFSDDDDTTTSIDVAEMAPDLIEALGIQTGVYNLSGQRVANDTRNLKAGIYIVNGKKTVVR